MKNITDPFTDLDLNQINLKLKIMLSKRPHVEEINGETWYINPLTDVKKKVIDADDIFVNEIGD